MTDTDQLKAELMAAIDAAETLDNLEVVRLDALGKKGRISSQLKSLGGLEPEERNALVRPSMFSKMKSRLL